VTPMTPQTKEFRHTPIGEELFYELRRTLGLAVIAGYLKKNGPYQVLNLYADKDASTLCWKQRMMHETWEHDAQYDRIREVLFAVLEKHGIETPIENAYSRTTGELVDDKCFNISVIDFTGWQEYWRNNNR
ncbi:MAG: hypothetical protein IKZ09_08350, partial [Clostridia bacterium]|nr:hypothetical protein [Clostridia bacterium]